MGNQFQLKITLIFFSSCFSSIIYFLKSDRSSFYITELKEKNQVKSPFITEKSYIFKGNEIKSFKYSNRSSHYMPVSWNS